MRYYILEPEVAGGLGEQTIMDTHVHPPAISKLHYEFMGWMGDELVASFPCFIVTNRLRENIEAAKLSGLTFADVHVSVSEQFKDLHPDRPLPHFFWLKVAGSSAHDDFGLSSNGSLVVSERALANIMPFIAHCDIKVYR